MHKEYTAMKTYSAKASIVVVLAVLTIPLGLGGLRVYAGWYTAESAPVMDRTLYHTVETPCGQLPTNRLTIGIGEQVLVSFNPACTDVDRYHYTYEYWVQNPETCQFEKCVRETSYTVQDSIGARIWEVSSVFNGMSGVLTGTERHPVNGLRASAAWTTSDQTGTIGWLLHCSEFRYDEVIDLGSVDFSVIIPTGANATSHTELNLGVPDPGGQLMHYGAWYNCQVLPANVCFQNIVISEYIPEAVYTWPNGSTFTFGAFKGASPSCGKDPYATTTVYRTNMFEDDRHGYNAPRANLVNPGPPPYPQSVTFNFPQYLRFLHMNGNWITFTSHLLPAAYRASDGKAHGAWDSQVETWRGPFVSWLSE
jgi:hypothetical protein